MADKTGYDRYLEFQYTLNTANTPSSSFFTALFIAIAKADRGNQAKIALGFPEEVDAYQIWCCKGGAEELQKKITPGARGLEWLDEDIRRWQEEKRFEQED